MNKMKLMSVVWGMVVVIIIVALTVFGFLYKNKTSEYKELEEKIVEAEKKYVEMKFRYPEENESVTISLQELKEAGLINEFKVNGIECEGYGVISHESLAFEYKGYVKCGSYKTKGYKE